MVRRRLRVGAADDPAEREADELARAVTSQAAANLMSPPTTRIRASSGDVIRRWWDCDWDSKTATWRGEPDAWAKSPDYYRVMNDGFLMLDVHGNTLYDPRAGMPKGKGGGGFALGSGDNFQATFNMFANPVTMGGPLGVGGPQETIDYGLFAVTHQGGGWQPQQFQPFGAAKPMVPAPHQMPSTMPTYTSSFVNPDVTEQFTGVREDNKRFPTQKKAMFGMSAAQANERAGQDIPEEQMDWLHRHRFQHGGMDQVQPNVPDNFVSGTHGSNIRHLMLENAVSYASEMYGVIPTSTEVTDVYSQPHHVAGGMNYTTHSSMDVDVSMTAPIDLRDPTMPRRADQRYANTAQEMFQHWSAVHEAISNGWMSPADLGADGAAQYQQFLDRYVH